MNFPEAFWIDPNGNIYEIPTKHIEYVIQHPKIFGMTLPEIKKTFRKFREPLGQEGWAREEIIGKLLKKGYARIRFRQRNDSYVIQIHKDTKKNQKNIRRFAFLIVKSVPKYTGVIIKGLNEEVLFNGTFAELIEKFG